MSAENATTTLKAGSVEVKISALHNKKFQCSILYVQFDTTEKKLLSLLLQKYVSEKVLVDGININNNIYSAIPGEESIVLFVPENKLTQNIVLLYSYLMKSKLTSQQCKLCKNGNFKKLSSDIKIFKVNVTGKCKNFVAALKNEAPKIERLKESLKIIEPTVRDNISSDGFTPFEVEIDGGEFTNDVMLYLSVIMGNEPCLIKKSGSSVKIECLSPHGEQRIKSFAVWKDTFQGKVKSFLSQSGSVGSPSANDKGKAKFNEKVKNIMKCQNELAFIYSDVRGFKYSFSDEEALKKVNSEAMAKVRALK